MRRAAASPRRSARKPRGSGGDRRREILAAARELMVRDGYDETSMRDIARRVGVSSAALYVYFPDKEALFNEVCQEAFMPLMNAIMAVMQTEADPLTRARHGLREYLRWGLDHPEEYGLILLTRRVDVEPYDHRLPLVSDGPRGELRYNSFALLVEGVKQLMAAEAIPEGDPFFVAELAWMACHGLVAAFIARPGAPFTEREQLIEGMVDMVMAGLQRGS
jgi:AcrR family transcriptional regulator